MMRYPKPITILWSVWLACSLSLPAAGDGTVSFERGELSGVETEFFRDLEDGKLDVFTPADAFLVASGVVEPAAFATRKRQLAALRRSALRELDRGEDPYLRGKHLLEWLYDNVLKTYRESANLATDVLDTGAYNCLSSAVLYSIFAGDLGLDVRGVLAPDHAFCTLLDPRGDKDVETTVRYGFDPGHREIERLREMTRFVYVPPRDYAQRETVTLLKLIATLYANRAGMEGPGAGTGKKGLAQYKKGYLMDRDNRLFSENLAACLNNLAVDAMNREDLAEAERYLAQGRKFAPGSPLFEDIERGFRGEAAREAAARGDYAQAVAHARRGLALRPGDRTLRHNLAFYYNAWAEDRLAGGDFEAAVAVLKQALKEFPRKSRHRSDLRIPFYNRGVDRYNSRDYRGAARCADEALRFFPGDPDLTELKKSAESRILFR